MTDERFSKFHRKSIYNIFELYGIDTAVLSTAQTGVFTVTLSCIQREIDFSVFTKLRDCDYFPSKITVKNNQMLIEVRVF